MGVRRALLTVLTLVAVALTGIPVAGASPENPTLEEILEGVADTYRNVQSIRAEFTQIRRDPVTQAEDRQKGKLALKRPRKLRLEIVSPTPSTFMTDGQTQWFYSPAQKQVIEQADLGASSGSGMGVLLEDMGKLGDLFTVTLPDTRSATTHTLHLVPKQAGLFQALDLTLTRQKYLLQDLVLVDTMGATTEMHFTSVKLDAGVPDAEFVFVAPPGVQVIKAGG